ncbi:MAG: ATP-dependent helicase, partial [Bacteroidetes bacterium]|nr:ATP-dependent helicase [Bacteroidota bacterium]
MANSQDPEEKFRIIYSGLNPEQKLAVDTIDGPVIVIAGPGTGKTQILSARIGKILLETDTAPQNILCMTYTEAGVIAMRKRLISFMGSDAYKVQVHTFHSFSNMVVQENARYFSKKEMDALSDLERIEVLQKLIDGFDSENSLKRFRGEIYYDMNFLASLFSNIKRENWNEETLRQQIDKYIQDTIPETDGLYNKRKRAKGEIELTQKGRDEVARMIKTRDAILSFKQYQEILREKKRYDYDDMINWTIWLFENFRDILLSYQERFQYILVDEYQDTSGSQNKIVSLLTGFWQDERPNIFVVGDDDQSIYKFQGANLQNLQSFVKTYDKDLVKIVLSKNYRSVQPILDAAKNLIENNRERLINHLPGLSKELISANKDLQGLAIHPVIRIYNNPFEENAHIVLSLKKLIEEGVSPSEIAVIYREHQ